MIIAPIHQPSSATFQSSTNSASCLKEGPATWVLLQKLLLTLIGSAILFLQRPTRLSSSSTSLTLIWTRMVKSVGEPNTSARRGASRPRASRWMRLSKSSRKPHPMICPTTKHPSQARGWALLCFCIDRSSSHIVISWHTASGLPCISGWPS